MVDIIISMVNSSRKLDRIQTQVYMHIYAYIGVCIYSLIPYIYI